MISCGMIYRVSSPFITRQGSLIFRAGHDNQNFIPRFRNSFHTLHGSSNKLVVVGKTKFQNPLHNSYNFPRFGISSSAKGASGNVGETKNAGNSGKTETSDKKAEKESSGSNKEQMSMKDLVKLVAEKDELLNRKHIQIQQMNAKIHRAIDEMENETKKIKKEAEISKKLAIQDFGKSLLGVADNLGKASSDVKMGFKKIDTSKDSVGVVSVLKKLLEGVEMTEKQFAEVFKKYEVEKNDPKVVPKNEQSDPKNHKAVSKETDATKPPNPVRTKPSDSVLTKPPNRVDTVLKWTAVLATATMVVRWWLRRRRVAASRK